MSEPNSMWPEPFESRIRRQLGDESRAFLQALKEPSRRALRLNTLKLDPDSEQVTNLIRRFRLKPVPWCPTGYEYDALTRPGRHPYHRAGLYYMQEPSAMAPVEMLNPGPGDLVLDLAAAPGGKTTQIAAKMGGSGLIVANDIHPSRVQSLSENIERCGVPNAVVTNTTADMLAERFPETFTHILVDAPCSGEGMFRKDEKAIADWSEQKSAACVRMQQQLLHKAAGMLRPGGRLVYSTCTFAPAENEDQIEQFLASHPSFELVHVRRIWPHREPGEGHFFAVMEKSNGPDPLTRHNKRRPKKKSTSADLRHAWNKFESFVQQENIHWEAAACRSTHDRELVTDGGEPLLIGTNLYWLPRHELLPRLWDDLRGIKVVRPGLHLAQLKKNRVEPAHALALATPAEAVSNLESLTDDQAELGSYLHGDSISLSGEPGWVVIAVDGFPLGWGKRTGGMIKNRYPKGLRVPYG